MEHVSSSVGEIFTRDKCENIWVFEDVMCDRGHINAGRGHVSETGFIVRCMYGI